MKTPFLDYWANRKERGEILEKRLILTEAQKSTLYSDSDVRAELQKSGVASLLPPVGTEVFRRFTPAKLEQINKCVDSKKNKQVEEDSLLKPAPELESEKTLPFYYGFPPPELRNVPLEDPDPFYQSQKTFVVVDRANLLHRYNAESSCFHFSPFSLLRRAAIKFLHHELSTVIVCLTLIWNILDVVRSIHMDLNLELACLCIYTLEAALKILSRGFCLGRFTYLRDSWNRLDVVIITTGFAFYMIEELWFLKMLRVIKILGLFSATRRLAKVYGRVLNRLWDVLLLSLLVLSVFSIIGSSLMTGTLRNKCVRSWDWETSGNWSDNSTTDYDDGSFDFYAYINDKENIYFMQHHSEPLICGNTSTSSLCPDGYTCIRTSTNPDLGYTNYDNFAYAFLATFRLMTRDFWENLAINAMNSQGQSIMIYFVAVFFFCTFSLTAFIIVAFITTFIELNEREVKAAKQNQKDYDKILAALKDKVEEDIPEKKDEQKVSCWRRVGSCDCCGCWVKVKNALQRFVQDPFFDLAIIIFIVVYIVFASCSHYPMSYEFEMTLSEVNLVFMIIFFLEVVLKIVALGPYEFFKVNWHFFDVALVVLSVVELCVADVYGLSFFRNWMYLRLFRLGRWWPGLLKWMRLVWAGLCSLWTLSLVLVTVFFSLSGYFLFGEGLNEFYCRFTDECGRWSFISVFRSLMVVTRALCGEWIETLWLCPQTSNTFTCVVFYGALLVVGNFLLLTLFFTLLMKWISDKMAPKDEEKMHACRLRFHRLMCGKMPEGKSKEEEGVATADDADGVAVTCITSEPTEENGTQSSTLPIGEAQNFQKMKETEDATEDPDDCFCQVCYRCCPSMDKSQGCGRVWSNLRRATFNIVRHPYFNNVLFLIILISSIALVCEDMSLPERPTLLVVLGYLDQVIMYLFVLEVLFKWLGLGFCRYFKDGWCLLDLTVTVACVLSVVAQMSSLNPFVISLKALRPLRIISHIKGTKRSVCALLKMVPSLLDVILVILAVWLFFALHFVSGYAGRFYYCYNMTSGEIFHRDYVRNKTECLTLVLENFTEVRWMNTHFNFDHVMEAYYSLFSMATMKGWIGIFYSVSDSGLIEDQPEYEKNLYEYLSFLLFFLFGGFFCLIHVLKVLLHTYCSQTQEMGGSHLFLTEKQMKNFNDIRFLSKRPLAPCPRPRGRLHGRLFDLVSREGFEWVMQGVILFSVVLLMALRQDQTLLEETVFFWLHFTLIVIFLLEFLLKICAFRKSYFSDSLNTIDFVTLILQIAGLFLADLLYFYVMDVTCLHLLRLGRLSRVVHRVPGARRLRLLLVAWRKSLPAVFNLALLLFLLMFTYASFGTFHFHQIENTHIMTEWLNFETFGGSLMCMLISSSWGGWDGFVLPPHDCDPLTGGCWNPTIVPFFLSFLCLSSFLVLMMLLVLLVDMLNVFAGQSCDPLSVLNLGRFFKTWRKFAPDSSHFIQRSQLPDLCAKLKVSRATELELSGEEQVHCRDVLLALSTQVLGDCEKEEVKARIDEKLKEFMPESPSQESCEMTDCTLEMTEEEAATPVAEDAAE